MINLNIIYKYCLSIIAIFPRCISQSIDWCRSDVIKNFVQRQLRYFLFIMLLQGDEYKSNLIFSKSNEKTGAFESYVVTSYRWISETYASSELFFSICRKKGKTYCFSGITIRILAVHNNHDVKSINQLYILTLSSLLNNFFICLQTLNANNNIIKKRFCETFS